MNKKQEQTIKNLKSRFAPRDGHEVKNETVEDWDGGFVSFHYEVGLVGDEGTMAEVYGRDRRWFKIGARGGVKTFDKSNSRWVDNLFATW